MRAPSVGVTIDADFARVGGKSYAIDKINCVDVQARFVHPNMPWLTIVFGVAAVGCLIGAINQGAASPTSLLAVVFTALAFACWRASKTVEYALILTTSSKDMAALRTRDRAFAFDLRSQIEGAMIERSRVRT